MSRADLDDCRIVIAPLTKYQTGTTAPDTIVVDQKASESAMNFTDEAADATMDV